MLSASRILARSASRGLSPWLAQRRMLASPASTSSLSNAPEAGAPEDTSSSSSKEKWRWSGLLLFVPGLATFGLGTWQILRWQWKVELLEHQRNRLAEEIIPLPLALDSSSQHYSANNGLKEVEGNILQSLEYRRVQCEGVFLEEKSLFLGPRGRSNHGVTERGYFLITPLIPVSDNGHSLQVPVLVNRGWVPGSWKDASLEQKSKANVNTDSLSGGKEKGAPLEQKSKANIKTDSLSSEKEKDKGFLSWLWGRKQENTNEVSDTKADTVTVVGVIRNSENPNMFVPSNDSRSGQWFFVDVPAMAQAVGLPANTIYIEALQGEKDVFKAKEYPLPRDPDTLVRSSVMPIDHISYAATWYTLSVATTVMAWKRLQKGVSGIKR